MGLGAVAAVRVHVLRSVGFENVFRCRRDGGLRRRATRPTTRVAPSGRLLNFPSVLHFDPYMNYPAGAYVPWPPGFDWTGGRDRLAVRRWRRPPSSASRPGRRRSAVHSRSCRSGRWADWCAATRWGSLQRCSMRRCRSRPASRGSGTSTTTRHRRCWVGSSCCSTPTRSIRNAAGAICCRCSRGWCSRARRSRWSGRAASSTWGRASWRWSAWQRGRADATCSRRRLQARV